MGRAKKRQSQREQIEFLQKYVSYLNAMVSTLTSALDSLGLTEKQQQKFRDFLEGEVDLYDVMELANQALPGSSSDQQSCIGSGSLETPPHSEDTHSPEHTVPDQDNNQ